MSKRKELRELEEHLAEANYERIVAASEAESTLWALRCDEIRGKLSKAAVRRAERRGEDMAVDAAPGWVAVSEAIDVFDRIAARRGLTAREQDETWGAICTVALYQLRRETGPFFDAAARVGLVEGRLADVLRREIARARSRGRATEDTN